MINITIKNLIKKVSSFIAVHIVTMFFAVEPTVLTVEMAVMFFSDDVSLTMWM